MKASKDTKEDQHCERHAAHLCTREAARETKRARAPWLHQEKRLQETEESGGASKKDKKREGSQRRHSFGKEHRIRGLWREREKSKSSSHERVRDVRLGPLPPCTRARSPSSVIFENTAEFVGWGVLSSEGERPARQEEREEARGKKGHE